MAAKNTRTGNLIQLVDEALGGEGQISKAKKFRTVFIDPEKLAPLLVEGGKPREGENSSLLHIAALWCDAGTVRSIMQSGGSPATVDTAGLTPGHYAAIAGNVQALHALPLDKHKCNVGRGALHYAAMCGKRAAVEYLLDKGAGHVDMQDSQGYTPLVIATLCGHPEIVRVLIDRGASAAVRDYSGTSALAFVARHYQTLADVFLDRYVVTDDFDNETTIDLTFALAQAKDTYSESDADRPVDTSYRMLVKESREILGHPAISALTDVKWEIFASRWLATQMLFRMIYNIFWTVRYLETEMFHDDLYERVASFAIVGVGYLSVFIHIVFNVCMARREVMSAENVKRARRISAGRELQIIHPLTRKYTEKMAAANQPRKVGCMGLKGVTLTLIVDFIMLFMSTYKLYATLKSRDDDYNSEFVKIGELAVSVGLVMMWLETFWMASVAPTFGRFVMFTAKCLNDILSIAAVYLMLFIPACAVFYHTIYRHDPPDGYTRLTWYEVLFAVVRMGFVDYNYNLGALTAEERGISVWWNVSSLVWIMISALIIINLFIALMSDRYSTLGEKYATKGAQLRAEFVAYCELFLGNRYSRFYERQILNTRPTVVTQSQDIAFQDLNERQIEKTRTREEIAHLQSKLDGILATLAIMNAKPPTPPPPAPREPTPPPPTPPPTMINKMGTGIGSFFTATATTIGDVGSGVGGIGTGVRDRLTPAAGPVIDRPVASPQIEIEQSTPTPPEPTEENTPSEISPEEEAAATPVNVELCQATPGGEPTELEPAEPGRLAAVKLKMLGLLSKVQGSSSAQQEEM